MNQVHKQCSKIDSRTVLSQTGSKTGRMHQVHSPQPSSPPRPRGQRLCRAPRKFARAPKALLQRPVALAPGHVAAPSAVSLRPAARMPSTCPCCIATWLAVSRACLMILVLQYTSTAPVIQPSPPSLQYNYVYCNTMTNITTHFQPLALQFQSQYNTCMVIQFPLSQ